MPFKWEGTLSQYVGRIHRTVADKTEVCVYDYVDLKVPMFSKMFGKRLRSYKKHNYKLNNEFFGQDTILFDKNSYKPKLIEDIRCAKKEIVLLINNYDVRCLSNIIIEAQDLCIRILSLNNFEELNVKDYNVIIEKYNSNGNAIIIDGEVIWYGDINPFKENIYDDSIMRIDDEVYAKELILEVKNQ
jgi:superfamily II DNA or RNA helicase